jgi:lysophospholipid acyltransferase (LPLAT)-like uncharacterized protein
MMTQFLAHILNIFIRLLNFTYRYHFIGLDNKARAIESNPAKTFVYSVWHNNLVATILGHIGQPFTMVISESKDGELVAVTCEKFGYKPSRGSSTRGGKKALLEIIKNVKAGRFGAMAVDGPKGPVYEVKPGVVEIARQCGCPILPTSSYASSMWVFEKSWDKFRLPKPFSKIVLVIGEPIFVPSEVTREEFESIQKLVAQKMFEGEEIAKALLNPQS